MTPPVSVVASAVASSEGPPPRRKRGRPRDPEADTRILEAAAALILLRGIEAMTVDEVATRAGVGKATVYRRFARKEDLAIAAMQQVHRTLMPAPDTGSLRGDLMAAYASVLAFANSEAGAAFVRTTVREAVRDERLAAIHRAGSVLTDQQAREVFDRARARGELREDVDVRHVVSFLSAMITLCVVNGDPMPSEPEVGALVEVVLRGIGTDAPTPP